MNWPTRWEQEHDRPCPHDYTFDVRLDTDGNLIYICAQCGRRTVFNVKTLKRLIRNRLKKQQEKERDEQEQGAGLGAGGQGREAGAGERAHGS